MQLECYWICDCKYFPTWYFHYFMYLLNFIISFIFYNIIPILFLFLFLLLFNYSCSHFPPITLPYPTHSHIPHAILPHLWLCPWVLYACSLMTLPLLCPVMPPLWLLSVCSLFPCLSFYFACFFVLLIRFLLQVR